MITYARKNIKGIYIEYPQELDAEYWKGKIGSTYEDYLNGMWIPLSSQQVRFHKKYPMASIKEVIELQLTPDPGRTLEQAKSERLNLLTQYDNSEAVNSFSVKLTADSIDEETGETIKGQTITHWFTPTERSNHKNTLDSLEVLNLPSVDVPLGGQTVTLPLQLAKVALARIQLYADQCYSVTQAHKTAVNALETIAEVDNYDFTANYPERLMFDLTEQEEQYE